MVVAFRTSDLFYRFLRKYAVIRRDTRGRDDVWKTLRVLTPEFPVASGATMGSVCGAGVFTVQ